MPKFILFVILFAIHLFAFTQVKKLAICKGDRTKMVYKQGQVITVSTKQNETISGLIYLIDDEAIYLNNNKEVSLKDITIVHPSFKPTFSFYKPSNIGEWLNMLLISFTVASFLNPIDLFDLWLPQAQEPNMSRKQRRLNAKTWKIGNTYNVCIN